MEFIIPINKIALGGKELTNVKISISDKYLFIIGMGIDGTYEEHLLEVNGEDSRYILNEIIGYVDEALDELDSLLSNLAGVLSVDVRPAYFITQDIVGNVLGRLRAHEERLNAIGNGWRRILDSVRIGRVNYQLRGRSPLYVIYSGNNVTLNLVSEPIIDPTVELITYTEGKATGIVRIRVGEDLVVKVDLRSASAPILLAQVEDFNGLNENITNVLSRAYSIINIHINGLLGIMRKRGVIA